MTPPHFPFNNAYTPQIKTLFAKIHFFKDKTSKTKCLLCGNTGSLQLFINNSGRVTYARVRRHQDKQKYTYCKLEKAHLKTLKRQAIQLPSVPDQGQKGQHGQRRVFKLHNLQLRSLNKPVSENKQWAGSSARIEHHPPKVGVVGSNPTPPAEIQVPFICRQKS
jgi:hypothetical protein